MKKYEVEIIETLSKTVEIEANSKEEAMIIAKQKYRNEEYILYAEDYITTDFKVTGIVKSKNGYER